ncbi:MAG TPA: hypothetical protein VNO22_03820 [Planctomycetota bacterium]|jgi:hypothetical protein|nr:hypothetical protein [Planctomycetota bacterium]
MHHAEKNKVTLRKRHEAAPPEPTWGYCLEEPAVRIQEAPAAAAPVQVEPAPSKVAQGGILITEAVVMPLSEWEHRQRVEAALEETNRLYGDMLRRLAE